MIENWLFKEKAKGIMLIGKEKTIEKSITVLELFKRKYINENYQKEKDQFVIEQELQSQETQYGKYIPVLFSCIKKTSNSP